MSDYSFISQFKKEFEAEIPATKKCIERIPEKLFKWKPHESAMNLGYLTLLVADIPRWLTHMINMGEINFKSFQSNDPTTTKEMVDLFDRNIQDTRTAVKQLDEAQLSKHFVLRSGDDVLIDSPLAENLVSTLNHWVHHRGQLSVYMRMNGIPVPSIYGPSADDRTFATL